MIQNYFVNEILTENAEKMIPSFEAVSSNSNFSLIKIKNAAIIQDCLEDEFFQSFVKTPEGELINAGMWTRSLYHPRGDLSELCENFEPDYSKLRVRKRILAACKNTGKPFIIALYRTGSSENENEEELEKWRQEMFKMNSLHSLIGIYEAADEGERFDEISCSIPTLHLIKRSEHELDDLIPFCEIEVESVRTRLIDYLTGCLNGNQAAAESFILFLVSRPSMRVDGLVDSLFIGKLCVNLCCENTGNSAALELSKILMTLKQFVSGPVVIESNPDAAFTKESIYPCLNVQTGQLNPGAVLQQPDGCILVVDESSLEVGEFKDQAVRNLQALIDLIRQQHVNYDFGMQQVTLKTDMPVVTVSIGKKSVLPFDLRIDCDTVKALKVEEKEALLFRSFLHHCRLINCTVTEEMAVFLEQDYLSLRKSSPLLVNGNPKMNEQEFHRLMNLARLMAVSHGQSELSKTIWEQTKAAYNI